jgi:Ubiquitin family
MVHERLQTGEETFVKMRSSTNMGKVYRKFAKLKGMEVHRLRLLLDGERIHHCDTAETHELDNQDKLLCVLEQVCSACAACGLFLHRT